MSLIRPFAWLAALIVALGLSASARAQVFQPFVDPGYFEPDFQWFAPAEVGDIGYPERPNTGFYATYDRTYVNVSRPINQFDFGSGNQGDFTWGNRWEVGYMTDDN